MIIQDLASAREAMAQMERVLREAGIEFRPAPPEPTTCCGRGCSGCVWEGYYAALAWWIEEARSQLA